MNHQRLWFDLHATVLHAEHALTRAPEPALTLDIGASPVLTSNGTPAFTVTPAVAARHTDHLATEPHTDDAARGTAARLVRLALRTRSPLAGVPLRDVLRRGAHEGHAWFTVDVDPAGLRAVATVADRDGQPPASAVWHDAYLTTDGLSTYQGQTCAGYRFNGGAPARLDPNVLHRFLADTGCSHTTHTPVYAVVEGAVTCLSDDLGDRTPVTTDADGWCYVAHPSLVWTATATPDLDLEAVFESYGPDGVRCGVCGAIGEAEYHELPSMVGYGHDTSLECQICGSADLADPMFGAYPRRKPWPPQPEQIQEA